MRNNITSCSDMKVIFYITVIIILVLIISPLVFLNTSSSSINSFEVGEENIEVKESQGVYFPENGKVKMYNEEKKSIVEIDLEEYIAGVVASEMPAAFEEEALKAQAVAARTYYINKRNNPCNKAKNLGGEICNSTHCQVYMNKDDRVKTWSKKDAENNWSKIEQAVKDTKGEVLTYENTVLEYPQFFAVSSGNTEDSQDVFSFDVPYLKSTESKGEEIAPKYKSEVKMSIEEFVNKINTKFKKSNLNNNNISNNIKVLSYTKAGSIKEIEVGGVKINGTEFRTLFNLNSTNFKITVQGNSVIINCVGYGHGVGMSQWGANVMAKNGAKYDEILKHYYTGVDIEKLKYK